MSWNDVDLKNVSATIEPIAIGEYTFNLLAGTKRGDNDPDRIELSASVAEGPFAGRRVYFSYPSPQKCDWSPRILKRLIIALGVDPMENEHPVEFFNRAVTELGGNARFAAPVKDGKVTEAYPTPKRELDIFKVRASA
jgi:hypothetical protein